MLDLQTEFSSADNTPRTSPARSNSRRLRKGIKSLKSLGSRGEIATQADDLKSPEELQFYAKDITELIKQAVYQLNATNRGCDLRGTNTNQPPYAMTLDANGNVTAVTYQGNISRAESEIAEGEDHHPVFGKTTPARARGLITDSRSGADMLNHLISLQNNLLAGNTALIASSDRGNLAKDEDNLLYHISSNGAIGPVGNHPKAMNQERSTAIEGRSGGSGCRSCPDAREVESDANGLSSGAAKRAKALSLSLMDYLR